MRALLRLVLSLAATLALLVSCSAERSTSLELPRAPIILISIDTLRADRLSPWGYEGTDTPAIERLASDGIVFEHAWSHVPLTLPSHVSTFTGRLPHEHGVRNNIGYQYDPAVAPSVVEALRTAGYDTGGAVSAYVLRGATGIAHGFDFWDDRITSRPGEAQGRVQRPGAETVDAALQWLDGREDDRFFLFLHLFEPHAPYEAPEPFRSRTADPYDAEIATVDAVVQSFLQSLDAKGLYDRSTIIVMSDHGEGLGDHGEAEHGVFLYREAIHVPLIVKLPQGLRRGTRIADNVQLSDVAATMAQLAGLEFESGGSSLLDRIPADRAIYSETFYPRIHLGWSELRSLVSASDHFIEAPQPELYDMTEDPAERKNVLAEKRRIFFALREQLEAIPKELTAPAAVSSEEAAKLAALGYIGTTRDTSEGPLPDPKERIGELEQMKLAFAASAQGNNARAIELLEALLDRNPRFSDAWNKLGTIRESEGDYAGAIEAFTEAARNEPSLAGEYALSIAANLYRIERFDEALQHLEVAQKMNPSGALLLAGRIDLARNDLAEAERKARASSRDRTHDLQGRVLLAEVLTRMGRLDEAMTVATTTANDARSRGVGVVDNLNFVLGDLWARRGELERAERHFRVEIAAFPHKTQTYANLALLYSVAGRTQDAREVIEEMVRANPRARPFAAKTMETLGDVPAAERWRAAEPQ